MISSANFFHVFSFTLIPSLSTPFTLTSAKQIRFTSFFKPKLLHICLHRAHHPELYPISKIHVLPRSAIRFSLNTIRNNQSDHRLSFALFNSTPSSLYSYKLILDIHHIPEPPSHFILFHFQIITFSLGPYKCSTSIHQLIRYHTFPTFSAIANLLPDLLAANLTMPKTHDGHFSV